MKATLPTLCTVPARLRCVLGLAGRSDGNCSPLDRRAYSLAPGGMPSPSRDPQRSRRDISPVTARISLDSADHPGARLATLDARSRNCVASAVCLPLQEEGEGSEGGKFLSTGWYGAWDRPKIQSQFASVWQPGHRRQASRRRTACTRSGGVTS